MRRGRANLGPLTRWLNPVDLFKREAGIHFGLTIFCCDPAVQTWVSTRTHENSSGGSWPTTCCCWAALLSTAAHGCAAVPWPGSPRPRGRPRGYGGYGVAVLRRVAPCGDSGDWWLWLCHAMPCYAMLCQGEGWTYGEYKAWNKLKASIQISAFWFWTAKLFKVLLARVWLWSIGDNEFYVHPLEELGNCLSHHRDCESYHLSSFIIWLLQMCSESHLQLAPMNSTQLIVNYPNIFIKGMKCDIFPLILWRWHSCSTLFP